MCKLFKGFIFVTVLLISFSILSKVNAANAYFEWEKTVIDVPLNSSLESYKDDFIVKLYVDGNESNDFYVTYETNCSTFTTVMTNKVGQYTVYYKAYSNKNYISSEQAIVFNVVDVNPPVVTLNDYTVEVEIGNSLKNYDWFNVDDDSDPSGITYKINDQNVVYTALGLYPASLTAMDIYNNKTTVEFMVKVVDKTPPSIFILKPLIFEYNEQVDISEYLMCQDNCDGDISKLLSVSNLDTQTLGKRIITVEVSDYSNNNVVMTFEVVVKDDTPPTIDMITNEIILDINDFEVYNVEYFEQYVFNIRDNYTTKENLVIEIDIEELSFAVSDYYVNYIAIDENNNKTINKLLVKLREFSGPEIIGPDSLEVYIGEVLDFKQIVSVYDEYDPAASQRLIIEENGLDLLTAGVYYVKLTCFNTSGIYSEKIIIVNVRNIENTQNNDVILIGIICGCVLVAGIGVAIFFKRKKK